MDLAKICDKCFSLKVEKPLFTSTYWECPYGCENKKEASLKKSIVTIQPRVGASVWCEMLEGEKSHMAYDGDFLCACGDMHRRPSDGVWFSLKDIQGGLVTMTGTWGAHHYLQATSKSFRVFWIHDEIIIEDDYSDEGSED